MAGTDSRFNATKFRDAIHFAMQMGLPGNTQERITFHWLEERTYAKEDAGNNPYDWTDTPVTDVAHPDVQLDAAVEFKFIRSGVTDNPVGQFESPNLVVTLLDQEYARIYVGGKRADQIIIDDDIYEINFVGPPLALFDCSIYQVYASALDEH